MVAFNNGDMLSISTEKEIFGVNEYEEDNVGVEQLSIMKQRRNRIAFQGYGTDRWEWYWLKNKKRNSASDFTGVSYNGGYYYLSTSNSDGICSTFLLKNL